MTDIAASAPLTAPEKTTTTLPAYAALVVALAALGALATAIGGIALLTSSTLRGYGVVGPLVAIVFGYAAFAVYFKRGDAWPAPFVAGTVLAIAASTTLIFIGPTNPWQAVAYGFGLVVAACSLALPAFVRR
jgi:hypothetical protein